MLVDQLCSRRVSAVLRQDHVGKVAAVDTLAREVTTVLAERAWHLLTTYRGGQVLEKDPSRNPFCKFL